MTAGNEQERSRGWTGWVLGAVVVAYLVAAYRPFTVDPPRYVRNGFEVVRDGAYVFDGSSVVRTEGPPQWLPRALSQHRVLIALEVLAAKADQEGPAQLFTVAGDKSRRNITIAQNGDDLLVRLRRPGSDRNGEPPLVVDSVFAAPVWRSIVVRIGPEGVAVEVDGRVEAAQSVRPEPLSRWDDGFRLALGSGLDERGSGWSGRMRRAVVDVSGVSVDYVADLSDLVVPKDGWYFPRNPFKLQISMSDVVLNVLGFLPFGAFIAYLRPGVRPMLRSGAASALLSLTMELGQIFVADRDPSVLDFTLNVIGGTVGGWLLVLVAHRLRARSIYRLLTSPWVRHARPTGGGAQSEKPLRGVIWVQGSQ